jgi:dihydrofolate reductase
MSKLRIQSFSISLDGYGAGPAQTLDEPLGKGGESLHEWMFTTKTFQQLYGEGEGTTGIDNDFAARGFENLGAWILGRNMFGPVRGDWPDESWKGWWGDNPPYHTPVFVLTHHPRAPQPMEGGTTFHFVTEGIEAAFQLARKAAGEGNISIQGGATTINQYLAAGLIDELRLRIVPITLGAGTRLFDGVPALNLKQVASRSGDSFTHVTYRVVR